MMINPKNKYAFTIVELLIIVVIVSILTAIVVPNITNAITKSRVARAYADMKAIDEAITAYTVDHRYLPWHYNGNSGPGGPELKFITTPVAYITSIPDDPFLKTGNLESSLFFRHYDYIRFFQRRDESGAIITRFIPEAELSPKEMFEKYEVMLLSVGPDGVPENSYNSELPFSFNSHRYDPTNGVNSAGEIYAFGDS